MTMKASCLLLSVLAASFTAVVARGSQNLLPPVDDSPVCGSSQDCGSCTQKTNCGWCAATQQCMNGTASGPGSGSYCFGSWEFESCTSCASFSDCRGCTQHPADCFWCEDNNGTCNPNVLGTQCAVPSRGCGTVFFLFWGRGSYPTDCSAYPFCSDCLSDSGCAWCESSVACIRKADSPSCNFISSKCCALLPSIPLLLLTLRLF